MRNSNDLNKGRPLSDEEQTELYLICGFVRTRPAVRFDKRRQTDTLECKSLQRSVGMWWAWKLIKGCAVTIALVLDALTGVQQRLDRAQPIIIQQ